MTEHRLIKKLGDIKGALSSNSIYPILALTAIIFLNSLRNGFVCDDWILMVYNEVYRSFDLTRIFLSKANSFEYLPVRDITLALDARIWGMRPFGFHLTNLLLYLASLMFLFKMLKNLSDVVGEEKGDFIAFWGTLVFAVHPLHTEVVNFVAARNNILAALFLFLSFNVCIDGVYGKKNYSLYLSAFLFILSLLSKASAIFYPFFLTVVFMLIPKKIISLRKKSLILLLFFAINGIAICLHFKIASATTVLNQSIFRYGTSNIIIVSKKALQIPFFYLKKLFVPYPLSTDYPVSFESGGPVFISFLLSIVVLTVVFMAVCWRKGHRLPALGALWSFFSLGPVLNIFPTSPMVADRYAYLAVLGFGLILAPLLKIALTKRRAFLFLAWGIIVVWSSMSFMRNLDWRSDVTILEAAISVNPDMDRSNLATALWNMGERGKALAYLKEERERTGSYNYSLFLGRHFFQSGRYPEALAAYQKALEEGASALKEAHLFIAEAYEKTGSDMLALKHYRKVFTTKSLDPLNEYSKKATEGVHRIRERLLPKLDDLRNTASTEPMNPVSQSNLAAFLYELGFYTEAEQFYLKSLGLNPAAWDAWYNLGNVYVNVSKYEEAIHAFEQSLLLKPDNIGAIGNIGICYMAMNKYQQAAQYYERVLDLDPNNLFAAFNLGKIYFNIGESEKAKEYLSHAKSLVKGNNALQGSIDQFLKKIEEKK